ncbi:hypothetical protein H5410_010656 [Solanum commersonii]|uniref:Uncharacterized protein n=1 Tax=Solanum commersonii TaxID=4109 RepID=A0A9J6ALD1_SOLCO|nr:hypothetical protein H5410_010656 [Solanum commersonii]
MEFETPTTILGLCRASKGTDTPVLSLKLKSIRADEETLEQEEEQEKGLSLWLFNLFLSPFF